MHKQYDDLLGKTIQVTANQLVGTAHRFAEYWAHQKLYITPRSGGMEDSKHGVLTIEREPTIVLQSSTIINVYFASCNEWWRHNPEDKLKNVPDCYIVGIRSDPIKNMLLGEVLHRWIRIIVLSL